MSPGESAAWRHLVEQRLEQVVVLPVHQGDLDRRPGQRPRRFQPAEAGAQNHHAEGFRGPGHPSRSTAAV
jgi:hypothetical protein